MIDFRRRVFEIGVHQSRALEAVQRTTPPPTGPGDHAIGPGVCQACGGRCFWGSGRWWHETEKGWVLCPAREGSDGPE